MSLRRTFSQGVANVSSAGRSFVTEIAFVCIALLLATLGLGFLGAAGFLLLERHVGMDAALTITGIVLLTLAGFVYLMRPVRAPPPPVPETVPDPLTMLVFDLSVELGRALFRRKR